MAMNRVSVNIRNFSVKCGSCGDYQTVCAFERQGELNIYRYECENEICDPGVTRTLIEVHRDVDEFARRDNARGEESQQNENA